MAHSLRRVKDTHLKKCRIQLKSEGMSMTKAVFRTEASITHPFCLSNGAVNICLSQQPVGPSCFPLPWNVHHMPWSSSPSK